MASPDTAYSGHNARIYLGSQLGESQAQDRTLKNYAATNGGKARPQPTVADLLISGWGLLLQETLQSAGVPDAMNDVLDKPAYNLGPDQAYGPGGTLWLVPVSTNPFGQGPSYREVRVYRDESATNKQAIDQQAADLANKQAELKQLQDSDQAAGGTGVSIDVQIAIAKAKRGQGYHSVELTGMASDSNIFTADSPSESAAPDGPHPKVSIVNDGMWEELTNASTPGRYGLPYPLIAWRNGAPTPATEELQSLITAARYVQPRQNILSLVFGDSPFVQPTVILYTPAQTRRAQTVLNALHIGW